MADLNLLTKFNEANTYLVKTIRPKLVKVVTTKHTNRSVVHSIRLDKTEPCQYRVKNMASSNAILPPQVCSLR